MDNVKSAVMAVCVVSAAKCLIGNIASASKLKSQIEIIMNLLLAVVMLSPFVSGTSGFELPEITDYQLADYDYSYDIYASALAEKTSENIESVLIQQITAAGVSFEKIEVEVNISPDYSISINRVTVTSQEFQAAADIITSSLGSETEVINGTD